MQSIELAVAGMRCGTCVQRMRAALLDQPGIERVDVSIGRVVVDYYPEAMSVDAIRAAIEALGYAIPVQTRSRNPLRRFLDGMAAANEDAFGHERLECCTMRRKR